MERTGTAAHKDGAMDEFNADGKEKIAVPSYRMLLFICCAVAGACYFGSFMRVPIIPLYARSFGADAFQVGTINAGFLLMAGIVSLPLGLLSDRLGRKLLIVTGLAIAACSSFLLSFSNSTVQLVAIHLLLGVGLGMFGPIMMSYVADISPATHLGRAYGWYAPGTQRGHECGAGTGRGRGGVVGISASFCPIGGSNPAGVLDDDLLSPARPTRCHQPPRQPRHDGGDEGSPQKCSAALLLAGNAGKLSSRAPFSNLVTISISIRMVLSSRYKFRPGKLRDRFLNSHAFSPQNVSMGSPTQALTF
jgi:hypothetical protein